jgi:caspase-like apoptosis-related cysteine protease
MEIFHNYSSINVVLGVSCILVCVLLLPVAEEDHSDCDCFLLTILSHGEKGFIYSRDTPYKPESLWRPFTADKCPTLAGKPKLFIFQVKQH